MTKANEPAYPIEVWKWIVGYENLYSVSNLGRVKSHDRTLMYSDGRKELRKGQTIRIIVHPHNGYCYVGLSGKDKSRKTRRVHRLVAAAHLPNPNNLPEINHEDYNRQNNSASNLTWCDRFYNNQHAAKKVGRKWQRHRLGKTGLQNPASRPVVVTDMNGQEIGSYESGMLAAKATGSEPSKISSCCLGKRNSHNNLKFRFA